MALSLPDPTYESESTRRLYPRLPLFEGFPYLVTRVVPAMYHVMLVPADASELELVLLARTQWRANRLETCLVTGVERAWFISADGRDALAQTPPRGGTLVSGLLRPAIRWADTAELQARQGRLDALVEAHRRKGGYILGDLTKGGREATADEVGRLAGAGSEGRPRGLERCSTCGDWRGRCLDPSPQFVCKVMTVHCGCQNDNRCAACAGFLYARKLNANYSNPRIATSGTCPASPASATGAPPRSETATMSTQRGLVSHRPRSASREEAADAPEQCVDAQRCGEDQFGRAIAQRAAELPRTRSQAVH
jgi:hypothetical protein